MRKKNLNYGDLMMKSYYVKVVMSMFAKTLTFKKNLGYPLTLTLVKVADEYPKS